MTHPPTLSTMQPAVRERTLQAIFRAVDSLNETLPPESRLARLESEWILGEDAKIESLGFVMLMVAVESEVRSALGQCPSLAEELTRPNLGVGTLGELADFLCAGLSTEP